VRTIYRVDTFCTDESMKDYDYDKDEEEIKALKNIQEREEEEDSILIESESLTTGTP